MTLEELLRSLPPPAKPLPMPLTTQTPAPGPMPLGPAPELPPTAPLAPLAPLDMNFVNSYAGAPPVAPTQRQPGTLEKIAAVLSGVALGPQYGMALREQREQPFRDYQRQNEQYQDRRARGLEIAERRAEREAEAANRMNEAVYEREYRAWLQKNGARDDEAKERMRQAFVLERDARAARLQAEEEQKRDLRQRERDAQTIANQYFTATRNRGLSQELGRYHAGLTGSLSPKAARLDAAVQGVGQATMGRAVSGGAGGRSRRGPTNEAQAALDRFNQARQALITALQQGNGKAADAYRQAMNRAFKSLARFPRDVEMFSQDPNWPFAQMRNSPAPAAAPTAAPAAKVITRAEMAALGITEAQARAEGYTIQ